MLLQQQQQTCKRSSRHIQPTIHYLSSFPRSHLSVLLDIGVERKSRSLCTLVYVVTSIDKTVEIAHCTSANVASSMVEISHPVTSEVKTLGILVSITHCARYFQGYTRLHRHHGSLKDIPQLGYHFEVRENYLCTSSVCRCLGTSKFACWLYSIHQRTSMDDLRANI